MGANRKRFPVKPCTTRYLYRNMNEIGARRRMLFANRTVRVFFIGNSVTDTVNYRGLAELAKSRGITQVWGRHMIPGAPLFYLWREKNGFTETPFGPTQSALVKYPWDIVTVQPFDRHLTNDKDEGDIANIQHMLDLAIARNPDVQFYVYARWPRITRDGKSFSYDKNDYDPRKPGSGVALENPDAWLSRWNAKYTGGWDNTNESRDYFEQVVAALNKANPELSRPVRLIPVGHAMAALDKQMQAGLVPGYHSIYQLYRDAIHLNMPGSYLVGCVFFATLYGQSPLGLPSQPYGRIEPTTVTAIQRATWGVIKTQQE